MASSGLQEENSTDTVLKDTKTSSKKRLTGTVHDFFGGLDTSVPAHFVLQWSKIPVATFDRSHPKDACLQRMPRTFKWGGKDVSLYCNVELDIAASAGALTTSDPYYGSRWIPLLKSHLQKCVRRCLTDLAVRTAAHLCRIAPIDLLRRLTVIMVEDVAVHRSLPALMWMTAAVSKGYVLTSDMWAWVLGVVGWLAASPVREITPRHDVSIASIQTATAKAEFGPDTDLVYALLQRRAFGGMSGDMLQLSAAAERWVLRLKEASDDVTALLGAVEDVTPIPLGSTRPLAVSDWELSAVDFHCSDVAKRLALRTKIDEERVKTAMWQYSSSISHKKVSVVTTQSKRSHSHRLDCLDTGAPIFPPKSRS